MIQNINQLIEINLKKICESNRKEVFTMEILDIEGNEIVSHFRGLQVAEEMRDRKLIKINKELCSVTEYGYEIFQKGGWLNHIENEKNLREKEIKEKTTREKIDLEKASTELKLNKWLIKTKWLPHIISILAIIVSVAIYSDSKKENENLKKRIEILEKNMKKIESSD